jgi:hypothetical protein
MPDEIPSRDYAQSSGELIGNPRTLVLSVHAEGDKGESKTAQQHAGKRLHHEVD